MGLMEEVFDATKGNHPILGDLFSGDRESPVYAQLLNAYRIYKFVMAKKSLLQLNAGSDYVVHADELSSYGIYKELEAAGLLANFTETDMETAYAVVNPRIASIVNYERTRRGNLYSHSVYFKSDSILQDYNQAQADPAAFVVQPTLL